MFLKNVFTVLLIVNLVTDSYGQRNKKKFRKDYTYLEAAESFFKIHSVPVTWAEAKQVCALEGAIFWHPESEPEFRIVASFWEKTRPNLPWLWTGLTDMLVEGRFQTVDGRPSSEVYINWQPHQPDNAGNEDCTHLGKIGDMNDFNCNSKALFICKKTLRSLEWNHYCDMPNLDYTISQTTGKCYKLHTTPLNWADANERCQLEQSSLAVISNPLEADYLVQLTKSTPKPRVKGKYQRGIYHLGIHNRFSEGWQTVGGAPFKVNDAETWFENYQPDGEEECGAMFFNGQLINTDCDIKSFFICEHKVDNVIVPVSTSLSIAKPFVGGGAER